MAATAMVLSGCGGGPYVKQAVEWQASKGLQLFYSGEQSAVDASGFRVRTSVDQETIEQIDDYVWCFDYTREHTVLADDAGWETLGSGRSCMYVDVPTDGSGEFEGVRVDTLPEAQIERLRHEGKWPDDIGVTSQ
ncbi:hypothetical protein ACFRCW_32925 [Streptomyces sp. NPDC056653]|uniref:hypothetical protein n=1 Tax=Streptomyces sp. NPDC056653 TaxID=3345894 RepID=UPI00369B3C27